MNAIIYNSDVERLRPLVQCWKNEANGDAFGLNIDIDCLLTDIDKMMKGDDSILLVLEQDDQIQGFMGIQTFISPLSNQKIANEHYWYVLPDKRRYGRLLLDLAKIWSSMAGCSHFMTNASKLASNLHDGVCKVYTRVGMKHFETTFIMEI